MQPLIIDRYLIREISKPLVVMGAALVMMFASFSAARFLAQVVDGGLPVSVVFPLVLLKSVIALDVLLPIALHLSVVVALGRLYTDSEMTALSACGVSPTQVLRVVCWVSLLVAVVVGCLSLYVRPWAYEKNYWLQNRAIAEFDMNRIEAGRFYNTRLGNHVIFIEQFDRERNRMKGVFIQTEYGNTVRVISAQQAYHQINEPNSGGELVCLDTYVYELPRNGKEVVVGQFDTLRLQLEDPEITEVGYKRKAASTRQLADSSSKTDIAELQWRLSTPLSAFLLGLFGFPLSRAEARQGKYAKLLVAVLVYGGYYILNLVARTWVEQGVVGPVPGIWWVHVLLASLLLAMVWHSAWAFRLWSR